jgi:CheY-like chemotaxis protein
MEPGNMQTSTAKAWFSGKLRTALVALYDPSVLGNSPLAGLLGAGPHGDPVATIRRALTEGVEALRPCYGTPQESRTWRVYQILRRRYIEQLSQKQVAADLGLSIRQLQREEALAREVLADHLWARYELDDKIPAHVQASGEEVQDDEASEEAPSSRQEELEQLRASVPVQMTDVGAMVSDVIETLRPLFSALAVSVPFPQLAGHLHVPLAGPILRQALLAVIGAAVPQVPAGEVRIAVQATSGEITIIVDSRAGPQMRTTGQPEWTEGLAMARELLGLCRGRLEIHPPAPEQGEPTCFRATVRLPVPEQIPILIIDDNTDALQLAQRFLSGTRYLFTGAQDAGRGFSLALEIQPRVIVLDVMMPERDGWAVLGQLREHPQTGHIPVLVCTILSQRELAQALGAAEFMRKPVRRADLLAALDRLTGPQSAAC